MGWELTETRVEHVPTTTHDGGARLDGSESGRGERGDWMPLTLDRVDHIVAIDDPALRNLWITQSYADLAERLLAAFETDQSWCTFATWASNTAGLSIREAELPHMLDALVHSTADHMQALTAEANRHAPVIRWLGLARLGVVRTIHASMLGRLVDDALAQVSRFIAHGNTLVYGELAPIFVRFAEWLEGTGREQRADADVDSTLRSFGVPMDDVLVHRAFDSYVRAATTNDPAVRAQCVLAGNVAAVLHEQQRLQNDITNALDAGIRDAGHVVETVCHRFVPTRIRDWIVSRTRQRIAPHVEALWEHVATRVMMTLAVPGQTLHLGEDVPALPDGELFPTTLRDVTHPPLVELLDEWDPTGGTGRGSAAKDWADLHERMGYIVNLFRSRQHQLELSVSPFSDLELATMRDGAVPRTI